MHRHGDDPSVATNDNGLPAVELLWCMLEGDFEHRVLVAQGGGVRENTTT